MTRYYYENLADTTIAEDLTSGETDITVATSDGALFPTGPCKVRINDEVIEIASRSGDVLTVATGGRGHDGTTAAAHTDGDAISLVASAEDYNKLAGVPEHVAALGRRLDTEDTFDDYFVSDTLSDYTEVEPGSAVLVPSIGNGLLSLRIRGTTTNDITAVMKSDTISVGDVYETAIHSMLTDNDGTGFGMGGIVMSNGTADTSAIALLFVLVEDANDGSWRINDRGGTFTNINAFNNQEVIKRFAPLYLRLEYDAANSFVSTVSVDRVNWFTIGTLSTTLTPTHVGLVASVWSDTPAMTDRAVTYEYLIKNPT